MDALFRKQEASGWTAPFTPKELRLVNDAHLCHHCLGRLVPIGNARANGKAHGDWGTRRYHKKCWREKMTEEEEEEEEESDDDGGAEQFASICRKAGYYEQPELPPFAFKTPAR